MLDHFHFVEFVSFHIGAVGSSITFDYCYIQCISMIKEATLGRTTSISAQNTKVIMTLEYTHACSSVTQRARRGDRRQEVLGRAREPERRWGPEHLRRHRVQPDRGRGGPPRAVRERTRSPRGPTLTASRRGQDMSGGRPAREPLYVRSRHSQWPHAAGHESRDASWVWGHFSSQSEGLKSRSRGCSRRPALRLGPASLGGSSQRPERGVAGRNGRCS